MGKMILEFMIYIASVSGGFSETLQRSSQLEFNATYLPEVRFVSGRQLHLMKYNRFPRQEDLKVRALSIGDFIYLREDWDGKKTKDQSELLHELVHYMQEWMAYDYSCDGDKERLAYYIQEKWLMEEKGLSQTEFYEVLNLSPLAMVSAMMCKDSETLAPRWLKGGP